jgi:hypothetical protein
MKRLLNQASVNSAEAPAIYDVTKERLADWKKRLILKNSLSTIQRIIKNQLDDGIRLRLKWIFH